MDGFHSQTLDFFLTLDLAAPRALPPEVSKVLEVARGIRPFVAVEQRLRAIVSNPRSSSADVAAAVSADLYTAQRLLAHERGRPSRIEDVLSELSRRELLALLSEPREHEVFFGGDLVAHGVWHESAAIATLARLIAFELTDCDAGEAYTAGLFHGLGELMLYEVFPTRFGALYSETLARHGDRLLAEPGAFGTDHAEVGAATADMLELSPRLATVLHYHHTPDALASTDPALGLHALASVVGLADRLVNRHLLPSGSVSAELDVSVLGRGHLPLKSADLRRVWGHFVRDYEELIVMVSPSVS